MALREERNQMIRDSRSIIEDQNKRVSEELDDEEKLDDAADKAIEVLLKKGKINL